MLPADVPAVMAVQAACYGDALLEPEAVVQARVAASPDTCWVASRGTELCAYLAAYRSRLGAVTRLHGPFRPASDADTLYLHDLAVHPRAHGAGVGGRLVDAVLAQGRRDGLSWSALVAVQGALSFWQRLGWSLADPAADAGPVLAAYGGDARYLVRNLAVA